MLTLARSAGHSAPSFMGHLLPLSSPNHLLWARLLAAQYLKVGWGLAARLKAQGAGRRGAAWVQGQEWAQGDAASSLWCRCPWTEPWGLLTGRGAPLLLG